MRQKTSRARRIQHDAKQNIVSNGLFYQQVEVKRKIIKKRDLPCNPLQDTHRHKNPQELRHLCEQQEKLILAQYKSKKLDHEFFDFVRTQLPGSKICHKILTIKEMTNEEAQEQLNRYQQFKTKITLEEQFYSNSKQNYASEEDEEEEKVMFKHYVKKVSMIEDNDDAYLGELGGVHYSIRQEAQEMEDEVEKIDPEPQCADFSSQEEHQYYSNDDVFEL